jgi:hypothetical protein
MRGGLSDFPELEVDGFDGVGGTQLDRVVQEGNQLVPASAPHIDDTGMLVTPFGVEVGQGDLDGLDAGAV